MRATCVCVVLRGETRLDAIDSKYVDCRGVDVIESTSEDRLLVFNVYSKALGQLHISTYKYT